MSGIVRELNRMPVIPRYVVIGSASLGAAGAILGLVIGLGHPATALFALIEGGFLAAVIGAVFGLLAGLVAYLSAAVERRVKD